MAHRKTERGQALILITFAIIGLIALTGLTVDGGIAYSERRTAQNAADSAAFAAALAHSRGQNLTQAASTVALTNGYDNNGSTNAVVVNSVDSPSGECPAGTTNNKDITVTITTVTETSFSNLVGIQQVTNTVTAITRSCGTYVAPLFNGNAIVSLAPSGKGFDATGNPNWNITGGGIFSNSSSSNAAYCNGATQLNTPSISVVGNVTLGCNANVANGIATGGAQYSWNQYKSLLPRTPACNGTATEVNGIWYPEEGKDGSTVQFTKYKPGEFMIFSSGLYCVTNNPKPYHGTISGTGVTFYITHPDFSLKFNGHGNLTATAPTAGDYAGVLMYLAPQVDANGNLVPTQAIDMVGNGNAAFIGSIIAPSADITMFGNSGTEGFKSQIIGYRVDTGGNANVNISYNAGQNYQAAQPIEIMLLK
jgi:Flp pilus assembly protein TadG